MVYKVLVIIKKKNNPDFLLIEKYYLKAVDIIGNYSK